MYREVPTNVELACPRCKAKLAPSEVATCSCGVWLTSLAASVVLTAEERAPNPVTRWWRKREPCPLCGDQMLLYNPQTEQGHFQGCEGHGFWIDSDAIPFTSLAGGIDKAAIARIREDEDALDRERQRSFEAERDRAERRREKEANEQRLARTIAPRAPEVERQLTDREVEERKTIAEARRKAAEYARLTALEPEELRASIRELELRVEQLEADKESLQRQLGRLAERLAALERSKG